MLSTSDFRKGMKLALDGELFIIIDFQHARTAQRRANVWTKLKNLKTGQVLERTFSAGENFKQPDFDDLPMQYLYNDGSHYYFMDSKTFEQFPVSEQVIGDQVEYLKENLEVHGLFQGDSLLVVELPFFIELKIMETDPGLRGDTASGGTKPAKLESGATVNVPLFLNVDDVIKVDRRTNEYLERVP